MKIHELFERKFYNENESRMDIRLKNFQLQMSFLIMFSLIVVAGMMNLMLRLIEMNMIGSIAATILFSCLTIIYLTYSEVYAGIDRTCERKMMLKEISEMMKEQKCKGECDGR